MDSLNFKSFLKTLLVYKRYTFIALIWDRGLQYWEPGLQPWRYSFRA